MRKIILLSLVFCFAVSIVQAEIVNTQGEVKVANYLRQMLSTLNSADQSALRNYNDIKTYIVDHPGQFTSADKAKLNALQSLWNNIHNDIITFDTQATSDFPGIK